jgi:hypothetical protein
MNRKLHVVKEKREFETALKQRIGVRRKVLWAKYVHTKSNVTQRCKIQIRIQISNLGHLYISSDSRRITSRLLTPQWIRLWSSRFFLIPSYVRVIWISARPLRIFIEGCRVSPILTTAGDAHSCPLVAVSLYHMLASPHCCQTDNAVVYQTSIREASGPNSGRITGHPYWNLSCYARPLQAEVGTVLCNRSRPPLTSSIQLHLIGH